MHTCELPSSAAVCSTCVSLLGSAAHTHGRAFTLSLLAPIQFISGSISMNTPHSMFWIALDPFNVDNQHKPSQGDSLVTKILKDHW